jgi:hypothetical protein
MASNNNTFVFTSPTLTTVEGKPTNTSLPLLQRELNDNATSIPFQCGDGIHGNLQLVTLNATYLAISGVAFNDPAHPGEAPVHKHCSTAAQITKTNRKYSYNMEEYRQFTKLKAALKLQLLQAVDKINIANISHSILGYANTIVRTLLEHLHTTYGTLTFAQLDRNLANLNLEFNLDEPLEIWWASVT